MVNGEIISTTVISIRHYLALVISLHEGVVLKQKPNEIRAGGKSYLVSDYGTATTNNQFSNSWVIYLKYASDEELNAMQKAFSSNKFLEVD